MKKRSFLLPLFIIFTVFFCTVSANAAFSPDFEPKAQSVLMINLDTNTTIYSKQPDAKVYPASTTKIMTYIIATENIPDLDNTMITFTQQMADTLKGSGSSLAGLKVGDVLTAHDLLYCMMVPSGNDAAVALATYVGGGDIQKFVDMMNQKAQDLGCTNTHFMNPHGLQDENHYTTASDLAKIAQYAMKMNYFDEITNTLRYTFTIKDGPRKGTTAWVDTTNFLINQNLIGSTDYYYQYARGIKTGHTDEAGYCLVSSARAEGISYLCVMMNTQSPGTDSSGAVIHQEMLDTRQLYRWAYQNFQLKQVLSASQATMEVPLDYAWGKDHLLLSPETTVSAILPNDVDPSNVEIVPDLPQSVAAPVKRGDQVGTAKLVYNGEEIGSVNLVSSESVDRSEWVHIITLAKRIVTSRWFVLIAGILVVLIIVYIVLTLLSHQKKAAKRKVHRYRKM